MSIISSLHQLLLGSTGGWPHERNPLQVLGVGLDLIHTMQKFGAGDAEIYEAIDKMVKRSLLPLVHEDVLAGMQLESEGLDKELLEAVQFLKDENNMKWAVSDLRQRQGSRQEQINILKQARKALETRVGTLQAELKMLPEVRELERELNNRAGRLRAAEVDIATANRTANSYKTLLYREQEALWLNTNRHFIRLQSKSKLPFRLPHEVNTILGIGIAFKPIERVPQSYNTGLANTLRKSGVLPAPEDKYEQASARTARITWENKLVRAGQLTISANDAITLLCNGNSLLSLSWDRSTATKCFMAKNRKFAVNRVSGQWPIDKAVQRYQDEVKRLLGLIRTRHPYFSQLEIIPICLQLNQAVTTFGANTYVAIGSVTLEQMKQLKQDSWPMGRLGRDKVIQAMQPVLIKNSFLIARHTLGLNLGAGRINSEAALKKLRAYSQRVMEYPQSREQAMVLCYAVDIL